MAGGNAIFEGVYEYYVKWQQPNNKTLNVIISGDGRFILSVYQNKLLGYLIGLDISLD